MASTVARSLTNDTATGITEIALTAGSFACGVLQYAIIVTNGTDHQALSGIISWSAVNKAGSYTATVNNNTSNEAKALSSGTLTTVWDVLTGTNKVTLRVKATSSLTPSAGYPKITYTMITDSPTSVTTL